ncbi:MAG: ABC transporter permease [Bacteroidetes bacterium]|nr:ABC transporter permease [Bacteroidota bacterium]MCW5895251.1 ABC transporter permease [Bacteroidota bacterium]
MSMFRALRPIVIKEFRQIRRDPTTLGILLVLPTVLIALVGYALNFDVKHIPLAIYDQSKTGESRTFLRQFENTEYFTPSFYVGSYDEIDELFLHGWAKAAIVIPTDFGRELLANRSAKVQILVDGADANSAGQAIGYATRMSMEYSSRLVTEFLQRKGRGQFVPIDFQPRIWYNPDLLSAKFLIPGLFGFLIALAAVVSTALTVVREKERGTMEQLMVSPLHPLQVIVGKVIPYSVISLVVASSVLLVGYLLFDIQIKGSVLLLYAAIFTMILGGLGQGLVVSSITDTQQTAFMVAMLSSLLPTFLLSGFVFPIASMPVPLQVLSNLAVNKFFLVVVRGVMLKGVGFFAVWDQFLYMMLFAAVTVGISARKFRKRTL